MGGSDRQGAVGPSDPGDVGGEGVDSVAVEVPAGSVVVFGGSGVGVPGQDLRVTERDSGVEGVGDRGVPQRVWADVPRDTCCFRDALDHPVAVAAVDRLPRHRSQNQATGVAFYLAGPEYSQDLDGEGWRACCPCRSGAARGGHGAGRSSPRIDCGGLTSA